MAFLTQIKDKLCKILIIKLVFEKNVNYFAENWQISQKIVIITSTPEADSLKILGQSELRQSSVRAPSELHHNSKDGIFTVVKRV
jgi:hypothetical protein